MSFGVEKVGGMMRRPKGVQVEERQKQHVISSGISPAAPRDLPPVSFHGIKHEPCPSFPTDSPWFIPLACGFARQ